MIVLLFTTLFLSTYRNTRAEISSEWQVPGQSLDEAADEMHDAEILRAVVTSMEEWGKKHNRTRIKRAQSRSVCYDHLGCFEDSGPFGYLEMLPSAPQEINTRFLLYSTRSRGDIPLLDVPFGNMSTAWSWADRAFNSSIPTKVIVHGFGSNCDHVWVYEMRSALMAVEECNVICVDWEAGAIIPNYVRAAANTRLVGKQLAMLLEGLASHINLKFDKVHLIGFSLGAHVAGFAGSQLQNISRITGLDPAGPLFEAQDPRARLDSSDAMFVDVIHSNGENLILGGLGSWQPMGHVDFYPNGGRMQTGCSNLFVGAVTDIIWSSAIEGRSLCNHRRAYKFFTDSVSPKCHFPSFPCETYDDFLAGRCFGCNGDKRCGNMGYYADRSTGRGQLYLLTRDEEPFCAHQYHVKVESSRGNQSVVSYGRILLALVGDSGLNETFPMTRKDDAELTVGGMLSRMLVPHPALGVPIKVQLIYQAYSGWISSGLNRWTIDKVLLSDSFGKTSSICKKGLVLNSGSPVVLPLYPGDCNHPVEITDDIKNLASDTNDTENKIAEENVTSHKPSFIPTQVIQIGDEIIGNNKSDYQIDNIASPSIKREDTYATVSSEKKIIHKDAHNKSNQKLKSFHSSETGKNRPSPEPNVIPMGKHFRIDAENNTSDPLLSIFDPTDILNLPWQPLLANSLDNTPNERESGRAFGSINTKFTAFPFFENSFTQNINATSEIVEPILKAPSSKNARSHDISKIKGEITEPILGSTTVKTETNILKISKPTQVRTNRAPKYFENASTVPSISETSTNQSHWVPSYNLLPPQSEAKNIWDQINNKTNNINNRTSKSNHFNDSDASSSNDETFSLFQWQGREKKEVIEEKNNSGNSFTIQFLPSRLVSFLEKAERYARNTLLPLVSAYTPKFLMFGQDMSTSEPSKKVKHKFVPLEVRSESKNMPIPEHTQEEKINLVKNIKPPNTNENRSDKIAERISTSTVIYKDVQVSTDSTSIEDNQNLENDVIKIVKAPDMTTTTLASITMQSPLNSSEKIIIVYPSNTRDDRKIQSHTYPEILQFESVYQQSLQNSRSNAMLKDRSDLQSGRQYDSTNINPSIHIDLPTYEPPLSTSPYPYVRSFSTVPQFIPVSYSTESQTISNIEQSQETSK